mmetsp:Transcript_12002/g.17317  ORF Transcript_12002/g.17317 Transcript_12002/m.17317 type:complete len:609 (+) Transcript_12002:104-1930(+)
MMLSRRGFNMVILTLSLAASYCAVISLLPVSAFTTSNGGMSSNWPSWVSRSMKSSRSKLFVTSAAPLEKIAGSDKLGLLDASNTMRAERGTSVRLSEQDKLKVAIIGSGLAGMVTAMDLADAGHSVEIFESRPFVGGKVSSWKDEEGNHIEMGLHVFFGCYYNLFGIMRRLGVFETSLRLKEHTHTFINKGGDVGELDFRFGGIGAPINGLAAFARTTQLSIISKISNAIALATSPVVKALFDFDGAMEDIRNLDNISFTDWWFSKGGNRDSLSRMWDPIAYALGFIDCDNISARCMLTIFNLFAVRSEASILRMCEGSPNTYLHEPLVQYLEQRGVNFHLNSRIRDIVHDLDADGKPSLVKSVVYSSKNDGTQVTQDFDIIIAACDLPGIKKLLPESFRKYKLFDNIYSLDAVPVITVQLRFNGWVTELNDVKRAQDVTTGDQSNGKGAGIDNLLYSADADYSCFADLAITSPADYYKPGEGSLLQVVITPADKYMGMSNDDIAAEMLRQTNVLFPSSTLLECTWTSVVKLGQSLYREAPGMDKYRPTQVTTIPNFFLAGSYTYQDYIDSMEGATKSGLACADVVLQRTPEIAKMLKKKEASGVVAV